MYVCTWTLFHFLTINFFFSQRNTFYTSVASTHTLRALPLSSSLSLSPPLPVSPHWERLVIGQVASPIKLLWIDEDKCTDGHIHVHKNIASTHTSPTRVGRDRVEVGHTLSQGCKTTRQTFSGD